MADRDTGGGANVEGDISTDGGDVSGRDDRRQYNQPRSDPRQTINLQPGTSGDSEIYKLWIEVRRHDQQIQSLNITMDDMPGRLRDLERTEVVIRPRLADGPEVIIRPAPQAANLSMQTLIIVLVAALVVVIALVAFLVFWTVRNG